MIKYLLKCKDCKQEFESWFSTSGEYDRLLKLKLLNCQSCESINVEKSLMSPNLANTRVHFQKTENFFGNVIEIDKNYMFKITQTVINSSNNSYELQPYGVIQRNGRPDTIGFFILHEGVVEMSDKTLNEITYKKMTKEGILSSNKTEWAGFTDKYLSLIHI